eukprot:gnl/TRDRNA2_/TRDRNA2_170562_c4_seq5.p1 gnl/TRDRNA2_/TRDRNA2_170562_c4~~gnl/TRDRNA2_/TRDRNA2_170562_c4_seq5.p1  ORF type:complete len:103 (+),score=4.38 gnl/TRDRNA2_/TRDRNA2_170562_c4_seq5:106-414(+)
MSWGTPHPGAHVVLIGPVWMPDMLAIAESRPATGTQRKMNITGRVARLDQCLWRWHVAVIVYSCFPSLADPRVTGRVVRLDPNLVAQRAILLFESTIVSKYS